MLKILKFFCFLINFFIEIAKFFRCIWPRTIFLLIRDSLTYLGGTHAYDLKILIYRNFTFRAHLCFEAHDFFLQITWQNLNAIEFQEKLILNRLVEKLEENYSFHSFSRPVKWLIDSYKHVASTIVHIGLIHLQKLLEIHLIYVVWFSRKLFIGLFHYSRLFCIQF